MQRYIKRKGSVSPEDIYIWTPALSEREDMEEYFPEPKKIEVTEEGEAENPEDQIEALIRSIAKLVDEGDKKNFNKVNGTPKVEILSQMIGAYVTAGERDMAWDIYHKRKSK